MAAKLELAQTVAVGAFNPYVVKPEWLLKYNVCAAKDWEMRLVPLGDGAAFRFDSVDWLVDNRRLLVSSASLKVDCGRLVSKVLSLLPHTPMIAVGQNFHFSATREAWGERPLPMLGARKLEDLDQVEQVRWVGTIQRNESRIEVTLVHEPEAVAILFNHHRNIPSELSLKAMTPEDQIAPARQAAERFRDDYETSCALMKRLFQMEVSHE